MGKHLKRLSFSKIIACVGITFWIFINLFGMVMIVVTMDVSPLVYLIGSADAVVAVIYATYAHKARIENVIKLRRIYGADADFVLKNKYGEEKPVDDFADNIESFKNGFLKF